MFTRNGRANGQIVAEQEAFRAIACIVYAQLLSESRRTRRPSRRSETDLRDDESDRPVRTTSSHQQIRSTRSDNKFVPANQIDPFGQQVSTSESDRPLRTTSSNQQIRSTRSTKKIAPDRSDRYITVTFFEVIKKIGQLSNRYITVTYLQSSRISDGYWTVILRLHSSKFEKIRQLSDHYITVTVFEVIEKIRRSEPQA